MTERWSTKQDYIIAINHVNDCIKNDNKETWWPNITRIDGDKKYHMINDTEIGFTSRQDEYDDAHAYALVKMLVGNDKPCTLFAYDVKFGYQPVDVIVGFLDQDKNLTLAWDNERVFPMIGCDAEYNIKKDEFPMIPSNTKWIVAACLELEYRKDVIVYGRTRSSYEELKKDTPKVYI